MAAVKLKPEPTQTGAFFRVRRGNPKADYPDETPFVVEYVAADGAPDFRSSEGLVDYDKALERAASRAHSLRIPVRNETGVEDAPPAKVKVAAVRPAAPPAKPRRQGKPIKLQLPDVSKRVEALNVAAASGQVVADFQETRAAFLNDYDLTKERVCAYSQRTHEQIQHQLLIGLIAGEARHLKALAYLESAFARIDALEQQLAEKSAGGMAYKGVWQPGDFPAGSVVTFGGSLWHAAKATDAKPSDGSPDWTLCCKRGRDGKDATK